MQLCRKFQLPCRKCSGCCAVKFSREFHTTKKAAHAPGGLCFKAKACYYLVAGFGAGAAGLAAGEVAAGFAAPAGVGGAATPEAVL